MLYKSSFAVIIPCYNEEKSIPFFESELKHFVSFFYSKFSDIKLNIIVVDNNSTDSSVQLLKKVILVVPELSLLKCNTQGYGAALKYGFQNTEATYFSFLDLDDTYPMRSLIDLLKKLITNDLDIIYGSRTHQDSKIEATRLFGNKLYVYTLKYLFNSPLTDVCSGMRVFKSNLKNKIINLKENDLSFSIAFTLMTLANSLKISESPILYRSRVGESKLSVIIDGILFFYVIVKFYIIKILCLK